MGSASITYLMQKMACRLYPPGPIRGRYLPVEWLERWFSELCDELEFDPSDPEDNEDGYESYAWWTRHCESSR